jgi:protein gp37
MGQKSAIEWTDATWNPITGCTKVSAGCDNCYAETLANRLLAERYLSREPLERTETARLDPFAVRIWPERLHDPLGWKDARRVFVNSMSDLFHASVPDDYIRGIFEIMLVADWHAFQVLTKRPGRARRFIERNQDLFEGGMVPPHIWMGTSIENQSSSQRVSHLRDVFAATRFLSIEPLIGPIEGLDLQGVHWVIVGGESGIRRRPIDASWVRTIRDECVEAGVAFFFKQWGGRTPKAGGRELDGREWSEMPGVFHYA